MMTPRRAFTRAIRTMALFQIFAGGFYLHDFAAFEYERLRLGGAYRPTFILFRAAVHFSCAFVAWNYAGQIVSILARHDPADPDPTA